MTQTIPFEDIVLQKIDNRRHERERIDTGHKTDRQDAKEA